MSDAPDDKPTHCLLAHRLFALVVQPVFRRSDTDAIPVMMIRMGEREAAMPLASLKRECAITDDSPDGRMLALIAEALDFVPALRLGDKLPTEILTGDASWEPEPVHLRRALTRLHLQLVEWMQDGGSTAPIVLDADALAQADADPVLRQQIQVAFQRAAEVLNLPSKEAVIAQLESLAGELAFIEALRDRLLTRVRDVAERINRMARGTQVDVGQRRSLDRLRYLSAKAHHQMRHRFDDQNAQVGEVMAVLSNLENHRGFIRSTRDWLYRSLMAWEPVLTAWDKAPTSGDTRPLLALTYQFLAPRFMPVTEWLKPPKIMKKAEIATQMNW